MDCFFGIPPFVCCCNFQITCFIYHNYLPSQDMVPLPKTGIYLQVPFHASQLIKPCFPYMWHIWHMCHPHSKCDIYMLIFVHCHLSTQTYLFSTRYVLDTELFIEYSYEQDRYGLYFWILYFSGEDRQSIGK